MQKKTSNIFLNPKWCLNHIDQIKKKAGPRYTPQLNVNLPISQIFDGLSRSEQFYREIRENYGKLDRNIQDVLRDFQRIGVSRGLSDFNKTSEVLLKELKGIKDFSTKEIPWPIIGKRSRKLINILFRLLGKIESKKPQDRESREKYDFLIRSIRDTQKTLHFFETYTKSTKCHLSNNPFLLLLGEAGIGKTHLLCDIVSARLNKDNPILPSVLVFGEEIDRRREIVPQVIKRLELKKIKGEKQFLKQLNEAGKKANCRALFILDAANEMLHLKASKRLIQKLYREIRNYPYVGLVISVRNGFEDLFINKTIKKSFEIEYHPGFKNREWEAVYAFFNEFKLPLPEIPLLAPEFLNPLFLLLFCNAFQKRSGKKKPKAVYRGHEGATYIFEHFIKSIADKIAAKYKLPKGKTKNGYVIWDTVIEKMAERMVDENTDRLSEVKVIDIIGKAYPKIKADKFLKDLESNMLVVKVPDYDIDSGKITGFNYRFPFQKFSDHLLARYIFKKYHGQKKTPKQFFAKNTTMGKYLLNSFNRGLIEALMIECPERTRGKEFIDVAPYLTDKYFVVEAFINSLIWRNPKAFLLDAKKYPKSTIKLINKLIRDKETFYLLLNAFITVAGCPEHPFNGNFLHQWLWKFNMPERDSKWSVFLHHQNNGNTAVERLLKWAWASNDKAHICDESLILLSITLAWFLTTPNRAIRDKATKGLVCILTHRLDICHKLLLIFDAVNDVYVLERLYAVAYGCAMRNFTDTSSLKQMALWIHKKHFSKKQPLPHLLLRDYARGVIEVALNRNIPLKINRKNIVPPYKSEWIGSVPAEAELKKKYYPEKESTGSKGMWRIWFSVIGGGDFDRYVIGTNSHFCAWSGKRFGQKVVDRKVLFDDFINSLTHKQKLLWAECDPIISEEKDNDLEEMFGKLKISVAVGRKKDEEVKQSIEKFKNSLNKKKSRIFENDIFPYLDHNLNLSHNPAKSFDLRVAQRWILNRVYELGWDPELHGEFDIDLDYEHNQGRDSRKPERIGKKYQWQAFHEFFARVSDNFEFIGNSWGSSEEKQVYNGPWQPFERDIDPSFNLKPEIEVAGVDSSNWERRYFSYNAWDKKESGEVWIKSSKSMPDPKKIILIKDNKGIEWLLLNGFIRWEENVPPEEDKYKVTRREIWYMLKSYIIQSTDYQTAVKWARDQHFMGRWMPESYDFYESFLGEYPNSKAYSDIRPEADNWIDDKNQYNKIPFPLMLTDDSYLNEVTLDCSLQNGCTIRMPSKFIVNGMGLKQLFVDGRFFDGKNNLIATPVSIWKDSKLSGVLIRKDSLIEFLQANHCKIFWTFLAEKNVLPPTFGNRDKGQFFRREISGLYLLNKVDQIYGRFTFIKDNQW